MSNEFNNKNNNCTVGCIADSFEWGDDGAFHQRTALAH